MNAQGEILLSAADCGVGGCGGSTTPITMEARELNKGCVAPSSSSAKERFLHKIRGRSGAPSELTRMFCTLRTALR